MDLLDFLAEIRTGENKWDLALSPCLLHHPVRLTLKEGIGNIYLH